jgi:hypothetical protein
LLGLFYEYGKDTQHMLSLENVKYQALRIALGLSVLSGIPPLTERFAYLNFRSFLSPTFEGEAWSAGAQKIGRCIRGYSDVLSLGIAPFESFTWHELSALLDTPLVDGHMEKKPANV